MKMTKKIMSLAIVFAMVMAMSVSVFAADPDGSITVQNATVGQTYTLYKIFDATLANFDAQTGAASNVSYTIEKTSAWFAHVQSATNYFKLEQADADTYYVTAVDGVAGSAIATWAKNIIDTATPAPAVAGTPITPTEQAPTVKWEKLDYGYYFVDSTLGSLCTIDTTMPNATVVDKNAKPTIVKKVEGEDSYTAMMGEDVDFTLTVNVGTQVTDLGTGIDADYTIVDTLPAGMTYIPGTTTTVTVNGATWEENVDYTISVNGQVVTFVLESTSLDDLESATNIVIAYKAELDNDAVVAEDGNPNTAVLTYNGYTQQDTVVVYTYAFDLVKTDGDMNLLNGAEFTLYDAQKEGNVVKVVKNGDKYQVDMDADASASIVVDGKVVVEGLANGTYWLEETKAPAGYNVLAERQAVTIENGSLISVTTETEYTSGGVQVINNAGTELPSTGGIGTTIFYALGGLMAVGAGVLLVAKKRMEA